MRGHHSWHSRVCPECFNPDPKVLAETIRLRVPTLRETPPLPGDDKDTNIAWARWLKAIGDALRKLDNLKGIPGGIMAIKAMEAYRELAGRKGKAA